MPFGIHLRNMAQPVVPPSARALRPEGGAAALFAQASHEAENLQPQPSQPGTGFFNRMRVFIRGAGTEPQAPAVVRTVRGDDSPPSYDEICGPELLVPPAYDQLFTEWHPQPSCPPSSEATGIDTHCQPPSYVETYSWPMTQVCKYLDAGLAIGPLVGIADLERPATQRVLGRTLISAIHQGASGKLAALLQLLQQLPETQRAQLNWPKMLNIHPSMQAAVFSALSANQGPVISLLTQLLPLIPKDQLPQLCGIFGLPVRGDLEIMSFLLGNNQAIQNYHQMCRSMGDLLSTSGNRLVPKKTEVVSHPEAEQLLADGLYAALGRGDHEQIDRYGQLFAVAKREEMAQIDWPEVLLCGKGVQGNRRSGLELALSVGHMHAVQSLATLVPLTGCTGLMLSKKAYRLLEQVPEPERSKLINQFNNAQHVG